MHPPRRGSVMKLLGDASLLSAGGFGSSNSGIHVIGLGSRGNGAGSATGSYAHSRKQSVDEISFANGFI